MIYLETKDKTPYSMAFIKPAYYNNHLHYLARSPYLLFRCGVLHSDKLRISKYSLSYWVARSAYETDITGLYSGKLTSSNQTSGDLSCNVAELAQKTKNYSSFATVFSMFDLSNAFNIQFHSIAFVLNYILTIKEMPPTLLYETSIKAKMFQVELCYDVQQLRRKLQSI